MIISYIYVYHSFFIFQNLKFDTAKSNFEENLDKSSFSSPSDYVRETAKQKTLEVVQRLFSIEVSLGSQFDIPDANISLRLDVRLTLN